MQVHRLDYKLVDYGARRGANQVPRCHKRGWVQAPVERQPEQPDASLVALIADVNAIISQPLSEEEGELTEAARRLEEGSYTHAARRRARCQGTEGSNLHLRGVRQRSPIDGTHTDVVCMQRLSPVALCSVIPAFRATKGGTGGAGGPSPATVGRGP